MIVLRKCHLKRAQNVYIHVSGSALEVIAASVHSASAPDAHNECALACAAERIAERMMHIKYRRRFLMNATLVFVIQATLSLLSFGLIARWVIYPRLKGRSLREALTPLLLFETFRTVGLIFLVSSITDAALPTAFSIPEAVGDMIAVVLAFVALVAVRFGWRAAPALIWLFTVEGVADFINANALGIRFNIAANYHLGIGWLIPTYGVPAFLVIQLTVIALLINRQRQRAKEQAVDVPERLMANIS
jgi:hypothetical protein